ncbi:MAG TPA: DUF4142 domain-containing protein [Minicystis sp.]|nr:DUF4142 domain-containing protein [Minicystis sp.]
MKRAILCAAAVLLATACRAENNDSRALGAEKTNEPSSAAAQARDRAVAGNDLPNDRTQQGFQYRNDKNDKNGAATANVDKEVRLFAMLDAMNRAEIETAKLAEKNASARETKDYAVKLRKEHEQDQAALKQLLDNKKIDISQAKDDPLYKAHLAAADMQKKQLEGLKGAAFDAAFLEAQPAQHELLAQVAKEGMDVSKDPDVDGFFKTLVGQAKDHEEKALAAIPKQCGGGVGVPVDQTADGSLGASGKAKTLREETGGKNKANGAGTTSTSPGPAPIVRPGQPLMNDNDKNAPAQPQTEPRRQDKMPGTVTPPESTR